MPMDPESQGKARSGLARAGLGHRGWPRCSASSAAACACSAMPSISGFPRAAWPFAWPRAFAAPLLAAGYLMGAAAGIAVLVGLVPCWGVVVPWLTALGFPCGRPGALCSCPTQLWGSKARFLGAGVIGISALWTVATLAKPIVQAIRQPACAQRRRGCAVATNRQGHAAQLDADDRSRRPGRCCSWWPMTSSPGILPDLARWRALRPGGPCVLFAGLFGFLVAAACGYMAGWSARRPAPSRASASSPPLLMGAGPAGAARPGAGLSPAPSSGQMGMALVLFMVRRFLAMAAISNDNLQELKTGYPGRGPRPGASRWCSSSAAWWGRWSLPPCWTCSTTPMALPVALPRAGMDPARPWPRPRLR